MKNHSKTHNLAILASGSGSNAANFMAYYRDHPCIGVSLVVSNNASAYVLERAREAGIRTAVLPGPMWKDSRAVLSLFDRHRVTAIVLAGYMRLLPPYFIRKYPNRIFNIHPALLPDFGGKGMYGMHVHRAVINAGVTRSGITIHLVNERYDEGPILFQATLEVQPEDTPETLATKVQKLEHKHYPKTVENHLLKNPTPL